MSFQNPRIYSWLRRILNVFSSYISKTGQDSAWFRNDLQPRKHLTDQWKTLRCKNSQSSIWNNVRIWSFPYLPPSGVKWWLYALVRVFRLVLHWRKKLFLFWHPQPTGSVRLNSLTRKKFRKCIAIKWIFQTHPPQFLHKASWKSMTWKRRAPKTTCSQNIEYFLFLERIDDGVDLASVVCARLKNRPAEEHAHY